MSQNGSLRILIPAFAYDDSFQANVAYTLRKMGHIVETSDLKFRRNRGRLNRILVDTVTSAFPGRWEEHETYAVIAARRFKPDLVLCLTQALRGEVLAELRSGGRTRCVAWWGDTPANMRGMGLLVDGWDAIFIKDQLAAQKMLAVGLNAHLMHEAMNPDWHTPQGAARTQTLAVVGNYYGYRQMLVSRLLDAGINLSLYGFTPPRWGDPRIREQHTGCYVTREEKSSVFEGALASLNCTAMSEGDSLNCRAFEICGARGLQILEDKPSVSLCFDPGQEVLTYRSIDDIIEILARLRVEPRWADGIREAGWRRVHAEHTYAHRLERILRHVNLS
jgi:spore maturation protein CgeB